MKPVVDAEKCNGCGNCIDVCPVELFELKAGKARVKKGECMGCMACESICDQKAIEVKE